MDTALTGLNMVVSYSCDECGKEFNLQIKLKKHINAVHEIPKVEDLPDYLDTSLEFTDAEKALYFDDLKAKYEEAKKELDSLELKDNSHQFDKVNEGKNNSDNKSNDEKRTRTWVRSRDFEEKFIIASDDYLPKDWRCGLEKKGRKRKAFESPDGVFCQGRRQAICYMVTVLKSSEEEIRRMRRGLIEEESWEESEFIPQGWLSRSYKAPSDGVSKVNLHFLNTTYDLLKSAKKALQDMLENNYAESVLNIFICKYFLTSLHPGDIKWIFSHALFWKIGNSSLGPILVTPSGTVVLSSKKILKHLDLSGEFDLKAKETVKKKLDDIKNNTNSNDIKIEHPSPRKSLDNLNVSNNKIDYNDQPTKRVWKKIDKDLDANSTVDDKYLPAGWKCVYKRKQFSDHKDFLAPDGTMCQGRRMAIIYMITELNSDEDDILLMRKGLIEEDNWEESEDIPPGWLLKLYKAPSDGKVSYHFIDEQYELLKSKPKAMIKMLSTSFGRGNFLNKFICKYHKIRQGITPDNIEWSTDPSIPKNWKVGMTLHPGGFIMVTSSGNVVSQKLVSHLTSSDEFDSKTKEIIKKIINGMRNQLEKLEAAKAA